MRVRRTRALLAGLLATALLSSVAVALISPKFTPVHLVKDADVILHGTLAPAGETEWSLEGAAALKGKLEGAQLFSAAAFRKEQHEELLALLKARPPAVLFACRAAKNESKGFVHAAGRWLAAKSAGAGKWDLLAFDPALDATFAGGTDMLAKMSRYILEEPGATVPVSAGMTFDDWAPVTKSTAPVAGLAAVQTGGKTCLFVASHGGDRLFAPAGGTPAQPFEELSARVGLDTRSKKFAWLDMDGDGLSDLVSFDGAVVSLRLFKNGRLEPAGTARTFKLDGNCLGLAAAGMSPRGTPRVLASTEAAPRLLEWSVTGWTDSELPRPQGAQLGKVATCIVADLNGDGWVDVLQPGEHLGVFWAGTADGFAAPVLSAVRCPGAESCFALCDADGDGSLDIFASGPAGNELWENDGHAGFRAVLAHSGSLSYKAEYRAVAAVAADLNHDGRPDLVLGSADAGLVYHFNRGFRCFGEQGEVRLEQVQPVPTLPSWGVQALAVADFNNDDSSDVAVAFAGGEIHCYFNRLVDVPVCRLRLAKGIAGPVTVSAWQGAKFSVCTGTWLAVSSDQPITASLRGRGRFLLRYTLAGRPARTKEAELGTDTPTVTLD